MGEKQMISVCMATYNGEKYILEQIESILKQLSAADELIISDDGSSDKTMEIINEVNDKRIKVYKNKNEKGYTGNFYNALSHAKGDYIFLSDQDDIWCNDKVRVSLKYLNKFDFVVSDAIEVNEELKIICKSRFDKYGIKKGYLPNLLRCRYLGCCMAFRKSVNKVLFPVPSYSSQKYPHDLWIALISERYFNTALIKKPLILYRRHQGTSSNGGIKSGRNIWKRMIARFFYEYYVQKQRNIVSHRR